MEALLAIERKKYHKNLKEKKLFSISDSGIPSNADKDSLLSVAIAKEIATELNVKTLKKLPPQTAGKIFEQINESFLKATFPKLNFLRPGKWEIKKLGNQSNTTTSSFAQYEHLNHLNTLVEKDAELAASVGNNYMVAPDIVIYQHSFADKEINKNSLIVDNNTAKKTCIRKKNKSALILHASISAKWTIRSDRAQNSRTEALGLIRNRKGRLPHIVVVTGEPLPSRIASLALGTGDIDCVYHFALDELEAAINKLEISAENKSFDKNIKKEHKILSTLIDGKRLKDISDLPLDLLL